MTEENTDFGWGRVGFVTIMGRPNVGKSTFINKVLGYHLTAVSVRPNTTRKEWLGILSDADSQLIFADTPGVHHSKNKMHEAMAGTITRSVQGNDMVACLCDPTRAFGEEDARVAEIAKTSSKPVALVVNKVDAARPEEIGAIKEAYAAILGEVPVFEISAATGEGLGPLLSFLKAQMPEGPFLYPEDQLTTVIEREIAEEIVREAANELVYQEIPQSLTVKIDRWDENEKKVKIAATVYVEREGQKGIVIGERGSMTNEISKRSREKLREILDKFVDVKLNVKVALDWQNKKGFLNEKGIVDRDA